MFCFYVRSDVAVPPARASNGAYYNQYKHIRTLYQRRRLVAITKTTVDRPEIARTDREIGVRTTRPRRLSVFCRVPRRGSHNFTTVRAETRQRGCLVNTINTRRRTHTCRDNDTHDKYRGWLAGWLATCQRKHVRAQHKLTYTCVHIIYVCLQTHEHDDLTDVHHCPIIERRKEMEKKKNGNYYFIK